MNEWMNEEPLGALFQTFPTMSSHFLRIPLPQFPPESQLGQELENNIHPDLYASVSFQEEVNLHKSKRASFVHIGLDLKRCLMTSRAWNWMWVVKHWNTLLQTQVIHTNCSFDSAEGIFLNFSFNLLRKIILDKKKIYFKNQISCHAFSI